MTTAFPIILHHFDQSPFSEKVRLVFGLKNIAWTSVRISRIMPRPDLMPMTGGYRRTPVLQIGADIYCDTQVILRELERRFPEPTLFPRGYQGVASATAMWTDRTFFQSTVNLVFGSLADKVLTLPDDVVVLPGHGDQTSIGRERVTNPYLLDLAEDGSAGRVTRGL